MQNDALVSFAIIVTLGITAQWLAWRFKIPSILLLLGAGILAGPMLGILDPDALFGNSLSAIVSLSVGLIMFEGGLTLRISEFRENRQTIIALVTIAALITWFLTALLAQYVLGLGSSVAILIGAIFVVTGPTVIAPMLAYIRPHKRVASILKWESILIDPVGALLVVLVYEELILSHSAESNVFLFAKGIILTAVVGMLVGGLAAYSVYQLLARHYVPEFLQRVVVLMLVVLAFVVSNSLQHEAGLVAVTVMGIILANQKRVNVHPIIIFKEDLRVLLISSLFILLAARLHRSDLQFMINPISLLFLALMIFVVRPLSIFAATLRAKLNLRERLFLSWLAPRGIVAVSVASLFSLRLTQAGIAGADRIMPITFLVVIGTVIVYSLTALPVAKRLELVQPDPQGALIVGANELARNLGQALQSAGFNVQLVDTNPQLVRQARMLNLPATYSSILSEFILEQISLDGIGRLLALTPNDELNAFAALRFANIFGLTKVHQLSSGSPSVRHDMEHHLRGQTLFNEQATYKYFTDKLARGAVVKKTKLTNTFDEAAFGKLYSTHALILFVISENGKLNIYENDKRTPLRAGQTLISLIDADYLNRGEVTTNAIVQPVDNPLASATTPSI